MANASAGQESQRDRLTMNEILESLGMSMLSQKFEEERLDFTVIMLASDEDLVRLGVRTVGNRVRLRDACSRVYTRRSTSISLGDSHRTSSSIPGREERSLLFSPSVSSTGTGEGRTGSRRRQSRANSYGIKRKDDYTWTRQFMCLSDCHAKKIPTPAEKQVLQKAGLGLKKIKFSVEDDEVGLYNQLTETAESDETAGYPQLKNCGGFELLRCIPNCKVLEPIDVVMSAKNLKAAAGQGKIYIRPIQRSLSVIPLKSESVKGKMCLLFERVFTRKFTSTFFNAFTINLLVR